MNLPDDVVELDDAYIEAITEEIPAPSPDEIRRRAFALWRATGERDPLRNWLRAERELRAA